jgi:hypothetical protein
MLYNLTLHLHLSSILAAVVAAACFIIISLVKEKRDERERA